MSVLAVAQLASCNLQRVVKIKRTLLNVISYIFNNIIVFFLGDHTLFQTSYNVCEKSWNQPEIEDVMNVALDIRKKVIKESPINAKNWNLSAIISVNHQTYDVLKVITVY